MTTTSIRPGHPYDQRNPYGGMDNITDAERDSLNAAFFEALNTALRAKTGDPSMQCIPQTGEIMYDCIGTGTDAVQPVTAWHKAHYDWAEIWRMVEGSIDVEKFLTLTGNVYPYFPEGRTAESAYYALNGPREQNIYDLEAIISECEAHIKCAPDWWDGSYARTLMAEAQEYLDEILETVNG